MKRKILKIFLFILKTNSRHISGKSLENFLLVTKISSISLNQNSRNFFLAFPFFKENHLTLQNVYVGQHEKIL